MIVTNAVCSDDQLVMALCLTIADRRQELHISQSELARRTGLNRSFVSDLERCERNLSIRTVSRLAAALELSASNLFQLAERKLAAEGPFDLKLRKRANGESPPE